MSDQPLVSIVTAFYNRADTVADSLGSLLNQTYSNLEIVAIDDGSTDATFAEMQKFSDPRLKMWTRPNKGFTHTVIEAVAAATGDYIACHDAGDVSHPERIAKQAHVLQTMPHVGVCGVLVNNPIIGTEKMKVVGRENGLPFGKVLLERNMFTHGEVMYRKALYDAAGGYRSYFRFAQDLDLWLRMAPLTDYHTVQEVLYSRYEIPGSVSATPDKALKQQRFSELARQSAESIAAGGPDLVETYGEQALDHLRRSKRLADKYAQLANRATFRTRDKEGASKFVQAAIAEGLTPRTIVAAAGLAAYPLLSLVRPSAA